MVIKEALTEGVKFGLPIETLNPFLPSYVKDDIQRQVEEFVNPVALNLSGIFTGATKVLQSAGNLLKPNLAFGAGLGLFTTAKALDTGKLPTVKEVTRDIVGGISPAYWGIATLQDTGKDLLNKTNTGVNFLQNATSNLYSSAKNQVITDYDATKSATKNIISNVTDGQLQQAAGDYVSKHPEIFAAAFAGLAGAGAGGAIGYYAGQNNAVAASPVPAAIAPSITSNPDQIPKVTKSKPKAKKKVVKKKKAKKKKKKIIKKKKKKKK